LIERIGFEHNIDIENETKRCVVKATDIVTEVGDDADKMKHVLKLKHYHKGPTRNTDDATCKSIFYFFKELQNKHCSLKCEDVNRGIQQLGMHQFE
jgi:hypothetical protein